MRYRLILFLTPLLLSPLFISCSSLPATSRGLTSGTILVTPPRDVVQNGEPHKAGKGSGERLQEQIERKLRQAPEFDVVTGDSITVSHQDDVDPEQARKSAERNNADYFLIVKLGEFLDAAPMTFRSDFVTLQKATLYETGTQDVVWSLTEPYKTEKSNIGSYHPLIDELGNRIVDSIREYVRNGNTG